ncbi:NADPH2:quinone reductase [Rhodococcus sp. 27YEA15]|uniref:zinc-binding dehydrogenase n=1 Tax=Rhodococcus sp. 27YEA15 TaxID=3156259 RepID=UPI003C7B794D
MWAIRLYEFGSSENLRYEQLPDPVPAAGEVCIAVQSIGVHVIETVLRRGEAVGPHAPPVLPMIPGGEVAGFVEGTGYGVDTSWRGRRVVARLGHGGGYAEKAVADVKSLYAVPESLSTDHAVAMIGSGANALGFLHVARPKAVDVALVMSAAGGIGSLMVQALGKTGAFVIGAAGGETKVDRVRRLGADLAVDYRNPNWADRISLALGDRRVSLVLDGVGGRSGRTALELLGPGGRILLYGWSSGAPTELDTHDLIQRGLTATWAIGPHLYPDADPRALQEQALALAAARVLTPTVTRFRLADAAAAHAALESRRTDGKVILTVGEQNISRAFA